MPGAIATDYRAPRATGIGESFETFFIRRFNLPRVLLLDVDQRVVWEGDPGLVAATPWKPGDGSFLDAPFEDLVARHKLDKLPAFQEAWRKTAVPALAAGDLAAALETLRASKDFEAEYYPDVAQAQAWLALLETALANPVATGQALVKEGADPALAPLVEWHALAGGETTPKLAKDLKPLLESKGNKEWALAVKACTRWTNVMARKDHDAAAAAAELLATLGGLAGVLPREFAAELKAALDAGDPDAFAALVQGVEARPRQWLARSYFGWKAPADGR
jgi:hypothetical protein